MVIITHICKLKLKTVYKGFYIKPGYNGKHLEIQLIECS